MRIEAACPIFFIEHKVNESIYRILCLATFTVHPITTEMDADITRLNSINQEQERLKSLLKSKTEELNVVSNKLSQNYALCKKTVKMAEPQTNWVAYGITDKK